MGKIKKVLFLSSLYRPNVGGVETVIEELSKYYKSCGINVVILTKQFPHELKKIELINKTPVYRIRRPISQEDFEKTFNELRQINKAIKADIVHIIGVRRPMPLIGLLLARKWGVPFIVNFSGGDVPDVLDPETTRIWNEANGSVQEPILQADSFIAFSRDSAKLIRLSFPKISKIEIVPSGIDINRMQRAKKRKFGYKYFISARRLVHDKGIDLLINAFYQKREQLKDVKLLIVGDGLEKDSLVELRNRLGLQEDVIFLGSMTLDELYPLLKGALAHICPSRTEAGGTINLEAQASKCLAVGSNAGGIPEYIIHNYTGLLFKSENINDLSNILVECYKNKNLRKKIISNAYERIQSSSWKIVAPKYLNIYEKALESKSKKIKPWRNDINNYWRIINNIKL